MNLLIVDDYPTNLRLLRAGLEAAGHQVCEAANGIEALQSLDREPVEAIISDVLMPRMDGFRLCNEIRRSAAHHRLPLVLYTSTYNSPMDRKLAEAVGADAYILKPAPVALLMDAIHSAQARVQHARTPESAPLEHTEVLERYNAVLVRKLESRNQELIETLDNLRQAHDQILELNRTLEKRVIQRTAALDAANQELEAFSYSVSHDLRAPLRHITGFAGVLLADSGLQADANNRTVVTRIDTAARQMNALIDALLEFARTSRTALHMNDVDMDVLLKEALATTCADAQGRNIEWRCAPLPTVRGDAALLRQVLVNLLSNAIKYTRTRSPAIIEIGARDGRENEAVIFVRDNGVGFDSQQATELFGVFKRLHPASAFEGTGIGLANAQRIIVRHGGAIWAEAAPDCGATFYFSLQRTSAAST